MILIEHKSDGPLDLSGLERDTVTLDWGERRKARQKVTSASGVELALALPTGSILEEGEIIHRNGTSYVVVEAAKEDVLYLYPEHAEDYALIAYEIGNRHLPLSISGSWLATPFEPHLEDHFRRQGIRCECRQAPFEPIRKGHSHG